MEMIVSAYLFGNILGRLAISYAFVWLVIWVLLARMQWRQAFRSTHSCYGLLGIAIVFLLGLVAALAKTA
jgi:hypothetical protein